MTVRHLGSVAIRDTPPDRRQAASYPNPGRRSTDVRGPWLVRRQEAEDAGIGLSTKASIVRSRLS